MNNRKTLNESDRRKIERGARRFVALMIFALLFACFSHLLAGCQKQEKQPIIYRVNSSEFVWKTNPENNRQKVPVIKDVVYLIVGEE